MASTPIKLGSAAGTSLIFTTGSKVTTDDKGVQSCSVTALYGDGQNVFSALPAAGTPFNAIFGNNYLPSDFKVDITGGGFDIEYAEGKSARVTINFKRPDPTQPPGPNGQRNRKVSFDTQISYKSLTSYSVIGLSGTMASSGSEADDRYARIGIPEPVVSLTYNIDNQPNITQQQLFGQLDTTGFPTVSGISVPFSLPAFSGAQVVYYANGQVITEVVSGNYSYNFTINFSPLGWRLTRLHSTPHADETFFDVEEQWTNIFDLSGSSFVGRTPR